jgi:hypothetical protein
MCKISIPNNTRTQIATLFINVNYQNMGCVLKVVSSSLYTITVVFPLVEAFQINLLVDAVQFLCHNFMVSATS